jgi:cellobiose-specific phosphotransferase system component IIA
MESFKHLPEKISSEDLIERIIVLHKINEALKEVENGQVHTNQSVMQEAREWLRK